MKELREKETICYLGFLLSMMFGLNSVSQTVAAETNLPSVAVERFYALGERGLFLPGQPIQMVLTLTNNETAPAKLDIEVRVKDFQDIGVTQQTMLVNLEPGKPMRHQFELAAPAKLGFFCVDAAVKKDGQTIAGRQAGFCVVPPMEEERDPFFAMDPNGIISGGYSGGLLNAFKMIGVGSYGASFGCPVDAYDATIPLSNVLEKVRYDIEENPYTAAPLLKQSDFNVVGYFHLDIAPNKIFDERIRKGLFPFPDLMFERYGEAAERIAELTKGRVKTWILQEEIDARGGWGIATPPRGAATAEIARHVLLERIVHDRFKKVSPACEVAMPGICCMDYVNSKNTPFTLLRLMMGDLTNHYDSLALDAYWGNWNGAKAPLGAPEAQIGEHKIKPGFRQMLVDATALQEQFGKQKKVLIAERGFFIPYHRPFDHPQSKTVANYVARSLILAKSVPSVTYYSHHSSASSCSFRWNGEKGRMEEITSDDEHPLIDNGLWKHAWDFEKKTNIFLPRSVVAAYATVARLLAHVTDPMELNLRDDVYVYLFKKKELTIAALWTTKKPFEAEVDLPMAVELCDLMGNKSRLAAGKAKITCTESPLFLICKAEPKAVAEVLRKTIFPSMPLVEGAAHLSDPETVTLYLVNKENRPVEVEWEIDPVKGLEWATTAGKMTLKPMEQRTMTIGFKGIDIKDIKRLSEKKITGRIKAEGQEVKINESLSVIPVSKVKGEIKTDGDLEKYAGIEPIILKNPQDIYPRDVIRSETGLLTGEDDIGVRFYMVWDEKNLYLAARVTDEKHLQRQVAGDIWKDDCLQFAFDTKNDALSPEITGKSGYDKNDYNFGAALTSQGPQASCWVNKGVSGYAAGNFPLAIKRDDKNKETVYELAIPWEQLAPLAPKAGQVFGFSFIVFDSDREEHASAAYWIGLTPGVAGGVDPSAYKTFMLVP